MLWRLPRWAHLTPHGLQGAEKIYGCHPTHHHKHIYIMRLFFASFILGQFSMNFVVHDVLWQRLKTDHAYKWVIYILVYILVYSSSLHLLRRGSLEVRWPKWLTPAERHWNFLQSSMVAFLLPCAVEVWTSHSIALDGNAGNMVSSWFFFFSCRLL